MNEKIENLEIVYNPYTFENDGAQMVGAHQSAFMQGHIVTKQIIYDRMREYLLETGWDDDNVDSLIEYIEK